MLMIAEMGVDMEDIKPTCAAQGHILIRGLTSLQARHASSDAGTNLCASCAALHRSYEWRRTSDAANDEALARLVCDRLSEDAT